MEENYIEIDTSLYGGQKMFGKGHDPYVMEVVSCCNTSNCPLFKNKQCIMCSRFARSGNAKCPYGKVDKYKGTNYRTKSYYDMKNRAQASPTYKSDIKDAYPTYIVIGDYTLMNLKWTGLIKHTVKNTYRVGQSWYNKWPDETFIGEEICIKTDEINSDIIKQILSFTPRSFFGNDIIKDHNDKLIPMLKADIIKYNPKLADELGLTKETINYVGRRARLVSLTPPFDFTLKTASKGVEARFNEDFTITCKDKKIVDIIFTSTSFIGFMGTLDHLEARFIPDERVIIEIQDNSWVNDNTVFER